MQNKKAIGLAGNTDEYSLLKAFLPWSQMTGGIKVPDSVLRLFPGAHSDDPEKRKQAQRNAALTENIVGSALSGALLAAAIRIPQHIARTNGALESDNPVKGVTAQLSTTYETPDAEEDDEQLKHASNDWEVSRYSTLTQFPSQLYTTALPAGAMLLSAGATKMLLDKYFNKERDKRITDKIKQRSELYNKLLYARAANAKGNLTPEQMAELDSEVSAIAYDTGVKQASLRKNASLFDKIPIIGDIVNGGKAVKKSADDLVDHSRKTLDQGVMFLSGAGLILLAASAIGGYTYTKASDPGNIKYDAIKKGLNEYAKGKSSQTPITMLAPSRETFERIDNGYTEPVYDEEQQNQEQAPQSASPRDEREVAYGAVTKPVSITL